MSILAFKDEFDENWKGLSLDGYMFKKKEELKEVYKEFTRGEPNLSYSMDYIITPIFCHSIEHLLKEDIISWYPFRLKFEEENPILPPYTYLYDEFVQDPNKANYYHFVSIFDKSSKGREAADHFVSNTGFSVKPPEGYRNFSKYRETTEKLLKDMLEPYVSPDMATGKVLDNIGFKGASLV